MRTLYVVWRGPAGSLAAMTSAMLATAAEGAEAGVDLPLSPLAFGLLALLSFLALLGLLWSFRNTLALDPSALKHHDDLGRPTPGQSGSSASSH